MWKDQQGSVHQQESLFFRPKFHTYKIIQGGHLSNYFSYRPPHEFKKTELPVEPQPYVFEKVVRNPISKSLKRKDGDRADDW